MQLTVQLSEECTGQYRALCPELGITAYGSDPSAAIDKLKTKILDWVVTAAGTYHNCMATADDMMMGSAMFHQETYALLSSDEGVKLFYVPDQSVRH